MAQRKIAVDPQKPLELNIVSRSPHVVGYRVWVRTADGGPWSTVADGDTADNIPDHYELGPYGEGTALTYWFGVAGNPASHYRALLLLGQGGAVLQDGTLIEEGTTNANGNAVVEKQVVLS